MQTEKQTETDNRPLYDVADWELETGAPIGDAVEAAGYIDSARGVINGHRAWSMTVQEFIDSLTAKGGAQ